jgi:uncharacterized protein
MEVRTIPTPAGRPTIQSYGSDGFRVSGTLYNSPVYVFPGGVVEWRPEAPIGPEAFAIAIERRGEFDLLLIGCGARGDSLSVELPVSLRQRGLAAELMATGAACRTYNLLSAEGRRVAAALLPVP